MEAEIKRFARGFLGPEHYDRFLFSFENGKRTRPLLMKKLCEKFGKDFDIVLPAASAIEILHCASLIHDDIIDGSGTRRKRETFHKRFGVKEGVLFGDLFAIACYEIFSRNYSNELKDAVITASRDMVEGQIMELKGIRGLEHYMQYIEKKTASLFLLAAKVPFMVHRLKDKKILEFAKEFGIAFQIANDLKNRKKERNSILSFVSRRKAEGILKERIEKINSLNIINTKEFGL